MQKYISLFFSVLLFVACKQTEAPPPQNVITEPKMVTLLTDLHLADGELYTYTPEADTLYKYGKEKYTQLFKKHQVTEKQFEDSYKYYSQQPEKIQAIYGKIDQVLKAKLDSLNKLPKKKNAIPAQ